MCRIGIIGGCLLYMVGHLACGELLFYLIEMVKIIGDGSIDFGEC